MSSSNKNIIKEAFKDAEVLKEAALEVAKQKLVKEMTPTLRNLVEKNLNGSFKEDTDRLRRAQDGHGETEFEENVEKGEKEMDDEKEKGLDLESLAAMFPAISEMGDDEEEMDQAELGEMGFVPNSMGMEGMALVNGEPGMEDDPEIEGAMIPTLEGDDKCDDDDDKDKEKMDEVFIDEAELKAAYESIMKTDKALSEDYDSSEWATEDSPPSDRGLAGKDKENEWEEEEPPAKKDHTSGIKEGATLEAIREGKTEVGRYIRFLESKLNESISVVKHLRNKIREVNLLNNKVLKVNEMLNKYGAQMTKEHKRVVLKKIDEAQSVREVQMVSEALEDTFKVTLKLNESATRKPKSNSQRRVTSGSPNQKVLRESVGDSGEAPQIARWKKLAGLVE